MLIDSLFGGSILTCVAFAMQVLKDIKELIWHDRVAPLKIRHSVITTPRGWPFIIAFAAMLAIGYAVFWSDLGRIEIGIAAIIFMLLLIFSGAHIAVVLIVLGGIYSGFFTPTEAGAAGAAAAIGVALAKGSLTWARFWRVLVDTGLVSVSILLLIIAASMYSRMLTLSTIPQEVTGLFYSAGLGLFGFMMIYLLLVVVMGMILDSTSIMLILLPLSLPIVSELGGNLIWFGIVTVIAVEIGLLTPPFGLTVYVVKATISDRNTTLGDIFIGTFPFVVMMTIVTLLLTFLPSLSLVFE